MEPETKTTVTVTHQILAGVVTHDALHRDDGGGWRVGHVDVYNLFVPFEGKRVHVTIEVLDE